MSRSFGFNQNFLANQSLNGFLRLPLTNEGIAVPDEFRKALDATLLKIPRRDLIPSDNAELLHLIEVVKKHDNAFSQHVEQETLLDSIQQALLQTINQPHVWNGPKKEPSQST